MADNESDAIANIYGNMVKMLGYREIIVDGGPADMRAMFSQLQFAKYAMVTGHKAVDNPRGAATVFACLCAPSSDFATKTASMRSLINKLPKSAEGIRREVILLYWGAITTHVEKSIAALIAETPGLDIEYYSVSKFKCEVPAHVRVPKHRIMSPDEVAAFCTLFRFRVENAPHIIERDDAMAIWLGLRAGMFVEISRPSETAGIGTYYRICVPRTSTKPARK